LRQICQELYTWREAHPEASFDEIAGQVTPRRRALMAVLLKQLAQQQGTGMVAEEVHCPECGQGMRYTGAARREVEHYLEGETELRRAYYHCERCHGGIFPPGWTVETGEAQLDTGDG
jgi:hypothetical protein